MAQNDGRTTARTRRGPQPAGDPQDRTAQSTEGQPQISAGDPAAPGRITAPAKGRGTPTYGAETSSETSGAAATERAYATPEFWVGTRRYGPY